MNYREFTILVFALMLACVLSCYFSPTPLVVWHVGALAWLTAICLGREAGGDGLRAYNARHWQRAKERVQRKT
jgi:hypothetical protein